MSLEGEDVQVFRPNQGHEVTALRDIAPCLIVTVDAGEDSDRQAASGQGNASISAMRYQYRAHLIFAEHGITPTYLINFAVASRFDGYGPLLDFLQDGTCTIGALLHPPTNPPFEEGEHAEAADLERQKIAGLTSLIQDNLGVQPIIYRAGHHGMGPNTARTLIDLGYSIDASVFPQRDFSQQGGPDFSANGAAPYWCDADHRLLELPLSAGNGDGVRPVHLSPECGSIEEAKALTRALFDQGQRVFHLSYHGASLEPGKSPYVKNDDDLVQFKAWIEEFLAFFCGDLGGRGVTPSEVLAMARQDPMPDDGFGISGKIRKGIKGKPSHALTPHRHDDDSQILRMYYSLAAPAHDAASTLVLCRADNPLAASLGIHSSDRAVTGDTNLVGGQLFPHEGAAETAIAMDGLTLKLADASADTAIMHHLIPNQDPPHTRSISREELGDLARELHRCLRPGGNLIMAFENSWAIGGITFWGYRKMLRSMGFGTFECFNILNEIDNPKRLISFDPGKFDDFFETHHKSYSKNSHRLKNYFLYCLIKIGIYKYLQSHFLIMCKK